MTIIYHDPLIHTFLCFFSQLIVYYFIIIVNFILKKEESQQDTKTILCLEDYIQEKIKESPTTARPVL